MTSDGAGDGDADGDGLGLRDDDAPPAIGCPGSRYKLSFSSYRRRYTEYHQTPHSA